MLNSQELDLSQMFFTSVPESKVYQFRGMIVYYGRHYYAFFYSRRRKLWLCFDDEKIKVVGNWDTVVKSCLRAHCQPAVLFYEIAQQPPKSPQQPQQQVPLKTNEEHGYGLGVPNTLNSSGGTTKLAANAVPFKRSSPIAVWAYDKESRSPNNHNSPNHKPTVVSDLMSVSLLSGRLSASIDRLCLREPLAKEVGSLSPPIGVEPLGSFLFDEDDDINTSIFKDNNNNNTNISTTSTNINNNNINNNTNNNINNINNNPNNKCTNMGERKASDITHKEDFEIGLEDLSKPTSAVQRYFEAFSTHWKLTMKRSESNHNNNPNNYNNFNNKHYNNNGYNDNSGYIGVFVERMQGRPGGGSMAGTGTNVGVLRMSLRFECSAKGGAKFASTLPATDMMPSGGIPVGDPLFICPLRYRRFLASERSIALRLVMKMIGHPSHY